MFEIRIFNERFNMDEDYYAGNKDIKIRVKCKTKEDLLNKWEKLLKTEEGETYSVWQLDGGDPGMIVGGAYDPGDWEYIKDSIEEEDWVECYLGHILARSLPLTKKGKICKRSQDILNGLVKTYKKTIKELDPEHPYTDENERKALAVMFERFLGQAEAV